MLGLVRHMAMVEQWWFSQALGGSTEPDLWLELDADGNPLDTDRDWHHTPDDTLDAARTALLREIRKSRQLVERSESLDRLTAIDVGPPDNPERFGKRSLRWILVHMIEEYARHCGHADMVREAIDGATGD
jgi:uncharacterized damage-inducible protein DinB